MSTLTLKHGNFNDILRTRSLYGHLSGSVKRLTLGFSRVMISGLCDCEGCLRFSLPLLHLLHSLAYMHARARSLSLSNK